MKNSIIRLLKKLRHGHIQQTHRLA